MENYVSSRDIAKKFGKKHKNVLRDIENLSAIWNGTKNVILSSYKNRGKDYKQYLLSNEFETMLSHKYLMRSAGTRFEESFNVVLKQMCDVFGFNYETQVNVDNRYRLDFYFRDLNIVVEYDEIQHQTPKNKKLDKERETYLIEVLGCTIIRVDYKDSDVTNASLVIKELQLISENA